MTFRKTVSAAVASTALIFTGFAPAMAAPMGPSNTVSTPLDMGALAWNAENEKAEQYRGYRGYRGNRGYRGYRHRRGRIDGGDVVAGILILGGIAAIASAASNSKRDRRTDDRDYRDQDYRSDNSRYDNRRDTDDRRSQVGTNAMERAISACSDAAERRAGSDARTSEITAVAKDGNGWRVEGQLTGASQSNFLCGSTNDQVDYVQLGDRDLAYTN